MKKRDVAIAIEERVDEIIAKLQREEGITEGDVDIEIEAHLNETIDQLARAILIAVAEQKRYNKGGNNNE